jgi:ribonucleoside-diphosphate reductase alpha chain
MTSEYYHIKTGYGPLHIHINYDETGPKQIFCNLPPLGTEISGLAASTGILISKYLEIGGDPRRLIKHLNSVKGDKPVGFGENRIDSIPHAISVALKRHLEKHPPAEIPPTSVELKKPIVMDFGNAPAEAVVFDADFSGVGAHYSSPSHCPECYSPNFVLEGGCCVCKDCGHSKCS